MHKITLLNELKLFVIQASEPDAEIQDMEFKPSEVVGEDDGDRYSPIPCTNFRYRCSATVWRMYEGDTAQTMGLDVDYTDRSWETIARQFHAMIQNSGHQCGRFTVTRLYSELAHETRIYRAHWLFVEED